MFLSHAGRIHSSRPSWTPEHWAKSKPEFTAPLLQWRPLTKHPEGAPDLKPESLGTTHSFRRRPAGPSWGPGMGR